MFSLGEWQAAAEAGSGSLAPPNRSSRLGARGYEVIALTMDAAGGDFSFQNARVALLSRPANAPSTPAAR